MNQFPGKNYFTLPNEIFSLGLGADPRIRRPNWTPTSKSYWPYKKYGHAICRCALGERTHLHRANLCPDKIQDQKERQSALYHQADP